MKILILMYILLIPGVALFVKSKYKLGSDNPKTVAIKAACTALIVFSAIIGISGDQEGFRIYSLLIASGLVLGLIGDIVICQKADGGFLSGMIYFGLGHLCYIAGFFQISSHRLSAVPIFIVIYAIVVFVAVRLKLKLGNMLVPTMLYAGIIAAMVSFAVTMPFSVEYGLVMLFGAVLFAVSDSLLAYGVYGGSESPGLDAFGLYCYYIGQSLFAVSIYCISGIIM